MLNVKLWMDQNGTTQIVGEQICQKKNRVQIQISMKVEEPKVKLSLNPNRK